MKWHWLPLLAACGSNPDDVERPTAGTTIHAEPMLAMPLVPRGEPTPAAFVESRAIYDRGFAAFRAREYRRSADEFVNAALVLVGVDDEPAAYNRAALFENAAHAWVAAGTQKLGRDTLAQLRKANRATSDELRRALDIVRRAGR